LDTLIERQRVSLAAAARQWKICGHDRSSHPLQELTTAAFADEVTEMWSSASHNTWPYEARLGRRESLKLAETPASQQYVGTTPAAWL
jgi:hypothetical protein